MVLWRLKCDLPPKFGWKSEILKFTHSSKHVRHHQNNLFSCVFFFRKIFQSIVLLQYALGPNQFLIHPWIIRIGMLRNDFVICYQRFIRLHVVMGGAPWAVCRYSSKYVMITITLLKLISTANCKYSFSISNVILLAKRPSTLAVIVGVPTTLWVLIAHSCNLGFFLFHHY